MVTGSNTGVGKQLAQILYSKDAKVYIATRSEEKAMNTIKSIQSSHPLSKGELVFLRLDLADLTTIKGSVNEFRSKENKLPVLFNNAGVMTPPQGSKTAQNYELQLGTNNLGHFLFTKLITPVLIETAKAEAPNTVRVVWVSSVAAERFSPKSGGIPMGNLDYHEDKPALYKYGVSKAGNYLQATEYMRRHVQDGIVSVALNPGNLDSDLGRHMSGIAMTILRWTFLYPLIYGAYTELFAGLSPEITVENLRTQNWSE
jgi:retinol dehydrogenase 12